MAYLYIIRGLPGSGKSTLAARMADCGMISAWYEADDYFYTFKSPSDDWPTYNFDADLLGLAHKACLEQTKRLLLKGNSAAVANTFSRKWEMQPYIDFCVENGIGSTVIECQGDYGSIHAPKEVREKMIRRWQTYP